MAMAEHGTLDQATDEELARRVREIMAEMAPLEEALGRLRAQIQKFASEQKKRERAQHLKTRMQVRTTVAQGQMPTLQQVAESSNELVPSEATLASLKFFFFQAEDGIRDWSVTGVQTCALPIWRGSTTPAEAIRLHSRRGSRPGTAARMRLPPAARFPGTP